MFLWKSRHALALQLLFVLGSESIGPDDSEDYGWLEHRLTAILKVVTTKFFIRFSGPSEVPAGW
jgi:hypothetical protein